MLGKSFSSFLARGMKIFPFSQEDLHPVLVIMTGVSEIIIFVLGVTKDRCKRCRFVPGSCNDTMSFHSHLNLRDCMS